MPRRSRIDAPDAVHHVIGRGIARSKVFSSNVNRDDFLGQLGDLLIESNTTCYAWALICLGADPQSFSPLAEDRQCSFVLCDEETLNTVRCQAQSASPSLWPPFPETRS